MLHHKLFPQLSLCEARKCQFINEIYRHFQPVKKPSLHIRSRLGFSTDWERHVIIFRSIACLRFLQPLPELLQRDNIPVAFLFLFSILFTPGVELTVADAARLDPRKAPLVFSAVCLEYRVIGLFQRPLLEYTDLPAFSLSLRHRPLAVLRADAPRLSKVAPAVFAPPHGDVLLHTALQGDIYFSGVQVYPQRENGDFTSVFWYREKSPFG